MIELHKNNNYKVVLVPIVNKEKDFPYHVINFNHDVIEYRTESLPQALLIAEQFDSMLEGNQHLQYRRQFIIDKGSEQKEGNVTPINPKE